MSSAASTSATQVNSTTTTLSDSSSDQIAPSKKAKKGKSSRSSSPSPAADSSPEVSKKKSRNMFQKVFHTIGGGSKKKTEGSTSSSSDLSASIPVDSSQLPTLAAPALFSDKILSEMLTQITIAVVYLANAKNDPASSSETSGQVTPRHFKADVIDVRAAQSQLTGTAAIEDSVQQLLNLNAQLQLPNWMKPLVEDRPLLEQISQHESIESITAEERAHLEALFASLNAQDRLALNPLSEDSSESSSS